MDLLRSRASSRNVAAGVDCWGCAMCLAAGAGRGAVFEQVNTLIVETPLKESLTQSSPIVMLGDDNAW